MIINLTDQSIAKKIDRLKNNVEINKTKIFSKSKKYIEFIQKITPKYKVKANLIKKISSDFKKINKKYLYNLKILNTLGDGDLRYHSFTLYLLTKIIKPNLIIETGVNNGKSTTSFLCALTQNQKGKLISIDKTEINEKLKDGRNPYKLVNNQIGFLVPENYKSRWKLLVGDSIRILNSFCKKKLYPSPNIFLHDSLHTFKHTYKEIQLVSKLRNKKNSTILILIDDIHVGAGKAFNKFVKKNNLVGYTFRTLGAVFVDSNNKLKF